VQTNRNRPELAGAPEALAAPLAELETLAPDAVLADPAQAEGAVPLLERAAFSPRDFAALFGRNCSWAYRQIQAGRVRAVKTFGCMFIPRSEVERLLGGTAEK